MVDIFHLEKYLPILLSLIFYLLSVLNWTKFSWVSGLGSSPFARRYLGNRFFFLFLGVLRCFSSPGCLLIAYVFSYGYLSITLGEFPHSEILGLTVVCTYPGLIAACHVLLRLLVPRHPPYALICLTRLDLLILIVQFSRYNLFY